MSIPYDRLAASLSAADHDALFAHEDAVETPWAVVEPVLATPPRAVIYPCGSRGPPQADRLTTVFPRQGHYAFNPHDTATHPPADISLEGIGDLVSVGLPDLLGHRTAPLWSKEAP